MRTVEFVKKAAQCPTCKTFGPRHSIATVHLRHTEGVLSVDISRHWCQTCRKHFSNPDRVKLMMPHYRYTIAYVAMAVDYARTHTLDQTADYMKKVSGNRVPPTTLHDWTLSDYWDYAKNPQGEKQ